MIFTLFLLGQLQLLSELQCPELTESSGVCISADGTIIWTHNDSGDSPRLFGFRRSGELVGIARLPQAKAVDWEDMCSFVRDGKGYLAVGDIGDNQRRRNSVVIYILEEPDLTGAHDQRVADGQQGGRAKSLSASVEELEVQLAGELHVSFPSGPVDCESLAYDPQREVFLLPSKEILRSRLFEVDASSLYNRRALRATVAGIALVPIVTGADISRDGAHLAFATYGPGCLLSRTAEDGWSTSAADMQFFELPVRKQGESICFDVDGKHLLLTSEFAPDTAVSHPVPEVTPYFFERNCDYAPGFTFKQVARFQDLSAAAL